MTTQLVTFLFPPQCAGCGATGNGLCKRCARFDAAPAIRRLPTLDVVALGAYRDAYRRAVLALKDGRRDVAAALGERLALLVPAGALLVPVRTTAVRRRVRGFDGVEAIARRAALLAGADVACALSPAGDDAQRGRSRVERLAGRGRFRCEDRLVAAREVLLVDDVCTTGTTLEDCAAAIRRAGGTVARAAVVALAENGRAA